MQHESGREIIFGATGGVGTYTATQLIDDGWQVVAVGHRKNDNQFYEELGAVYCSVDIRDITSFDVLPQTDVFAVIHLAGMLPARMSGYDP